VRAQALDSTRDTLVDKWFIVLKVGRQGSSNCTTVLIVPELEKTM
jgi:hypothetical protein